MLRVIFDLLQLVNRGNIAVLVLLDLSAAVDTVDHNILLYRLTESFGIRGVAVDWFRFYLTGRTQHVRLYEADQSNIIPVTCGVPRGVSSRLNPVPLVQR